MAGRRFFEEEIMPTAQVTDWGTAFITSITAALAVLAAGIPRLIAFILIILIGWFIANLLARGVAALLRRVRFDDVAQRSGFSGFVDKMGVQTDASGFVAEVARWFVRLITLIVAFDALGLPAVSAVLQDFLLWLPNLVVALVVLVIAGLAARAVAGLVRGSAAQAGLGNPDLLAGIASVAIWGFGIIIAVNQIGVAQTLVNTLFIAFVGALALAFALMFGLGGRETAGEILRSWYGQVQREAPKLQRAANDATEPSRGPARETPRPGDPRDRRSS
jgi:hypothetical protein